MVIKLEEEECYAADVKDYELTGWKPDTIVIVSSATKVIYLLNGVIIYSLKGFSEVLVLSKMCKDFLEVWSEAISIIDILLVK